MAVRACKEIRHQGGSAFRAVASFGRHGIMREEHFFEMAGNLTVEVVFMATDEEAVQFLELIRQEKVDIFYVKMSAEYGVTTQD